MSYCIVSKDKVLSAAKVAVAKLEIGESKRRLAYKAMASFEKRNMKMFREECISGNISGEDLNFLEGNVTDPNEYRKSPDYVERIFELEQLIALCQVGEDINLSKEDAKLLFGDES